MTTTRPPAHGGCIVLLLPAHDEVATVADVIARAPAEVAELDVRCVVIDDGSVDGTGAAARAAGAHVITHLVCRGLGAAVRTGLRYAVEQDAAAVAFCDADGEYAPEELDHMVRPILDGSADYVVGSRFAGDIRHMRPHRRVGNLTLTWALRLLTGSRWFAGAQGGAEPAEMRGGGGPAEMRGGPAITDGQSGYRALSHRAAAAAQIVHDYNYAQVLTLNLLRQGFVYAEVPISYAFRRHGRSFVRLHRYLARVVPAVWRELRRPLPCACDASPCSCAATSGTTVTAPTVDTDQERSLPWQPTSTTSSTS